MADTKGTLRYVRDDGTIEAFTISWADPHEAMRAGNDALPDDDLRKITREDVILLHDVSVMLGISNVARQLDFLAAKLAALSPPEITRAGAGRGDAAVTG